MLSVLLKRMDDGEKQICFSELYLLSSVELFHGFHEQEDCIYALFSTRITLNEVFFWGKNDKVILTAAVEKRCDLLLTNADGF